MTVARIICDSADRSRWLEARRNMITASDAGVILGIVGSPARLWAEKRGGPGIEDAEHLLIGRLIEPSIRTIYRAQTGHTCVGDGMLYVRHFDDLRVGATLDGWTWVNGHDVDRVPLELKNVSEWAAKDWIDGPPAHYQAQVQVQMLVTGADEAVICALIGGRRTEVYRVAADPELQARFLVAARAFWDRVVSGECPPDTDLGRYVAEEGGVVDFDLATEEGQRVVALTKRADMIAAQRKTLESEEEDVRCQLKAAIGNRSKATIPDLGSWSYTTSSRTTYREAKPGEKATHLQEHAPTRVLRRSKPR